MAPFAQKRVLAHERPENKIGRPSEYKPEYCQAVIDYMGQGYSLSAFAGSIKVSRNAVYEWMSEHSDFGDAVSRGRATRVTALERKLLAARYGAQASTSIFALRNADPSEWRDVRQVQHDHAAVRTTDPRRQRRVGAQCQEPLDERREQPGADDPQRVERLRGRVRVVRRRPVEPSAPGSGAR